MDSDEIKGKLSTSMRAVLRVRMQNNSYSLENKRENPSGLVAGRRAIRLSKFAELGARAIDQTQSCDRNQESDVVTIIVVVVFVN